MFAGKQRAVWRQVGDVLVTKALRWASVLGLDPEPGLVVAGMWVKLVYRPAASPALLQLRESAFVTLVLCTLAHASLSVCGSNPTIVAAPLVHLCPSGILFCPAEACVVCAHG